MTETYTPEESMQNGRYLEYGGQYLPEILLPEIKRVEAAYNQYKDDPDFLNEFHTLLREYAGRPSLLYYAKNMTEDLGGARFTSSVKTSTTLGHTRSTTLSAKH